MSPQERRWLLAEMDLVTTDDLLEALGCSKDTFAILREHGLLPIGPGRQKFYRKSAIAQVMESEARSRGTGDEGSKADKA